MTKEQMIILNNRLANLHDEISTIINLSDDTQLKHDLLKIAMEVTQAKMAYCDVYVMAGVYDEQ